jgi:kumamolisin
MPGAQSIGKADAAERLEVSVLVRRHSPTAIRTQVSALLHRRQAAGGHIKRADFAGQHGASEQDLASVRAFATHYGLAVTQQDAARRTIVLSGTVAQFNDAFDVDLQRFTHEGGSYRGRTGEIHVPTALQGVVEAVLGLDNRPAALPHFRKPMVAQAMVNTAYTPLQIAELYNFPPGDGKGQTIGIIELGGGYRPADLTAYFAALHIPHPQVTSMSIDHASNRPTGSAAGPDGEVMLDIEVAGAVAPGAHYVVYFAPNTDAGFLDAITTALHDTVNRPDILSISWGGAEQNWTPQALNAFDQAFQDAAVLGVTVLVAAGDDGSADNIADGQNHVDFPASSPHVTACGGTNIQVAGNKITRETVWNALPQGGAGGGGVSVVFPVPVYQAGAAATETGGEPKKLTMRGVPDIAGDADPASGYRVRVDGSNTVIGGTSAVAPLWAGLIALINQQHGQAVGFINPALYANANALNEIVTGNNGGYAAGANWNACTGLGSPNGAVLVTKLP